METVFIIFVPVFLISAFFAARGIATGKIKFGYKYYGKGITGNRWEDPFSFWMGIAIYSIVALVSLSILLYEIYKIQVI